MDEIPKGISIQKENSEKAPAEKKDTPPDSKNTVKVGQTIEFD
jgi:hypothetical protein